MEDWSNYPVSALNSCSPDQTKAQEAVLEHSEYYLLS